MMQTEMQEKPEIIISTAGDPRSVQAQKRDARTATEAAAQRCKNAAARRLLQEWLADESGYDEAVWPKIKQLIEENRLSARKRFCD
jgi:hypothetical protein